MYFSVLHEIAGVCLGAAVTYQQVLFAALNPEKELVQIKRDLDSAVSLGVARFYDCTSVLICQDQNINNYFLHWLQNNQDVKVDLYSLLLPLVRACSSHHTVVHF